MDDDDPQIRLDLLAEEFVTRERRGERPSVDQYAQAHPDLAGEIEEIFPLLAAMESAKPEADDAALPPGAEIGEYRLVRVIGRGGMGVVYEAEQKLLGRRVALKVLPHLAHLDRRAVERFRVEARAAAGLEHPRIVPVIGYGRDHGIHFYTMQYIEGRGLDDVIEEARTAGRGGSAHHREAARIALEAAEGIAHAHAHGVLHRDVKPSNVMLDAQGHVFITDFGLCKAEDSDDLTHSGDLLGTARYMAPERFSGTSDARGDVYGLGITLYELLTQRRVYDEVEGRAELIARITREPLPRPRALVPAIPLDLDTIVRKATAHDPEQRYQTCDAFAADLRAFLGGRPISARAPSVAYLLRSAVSRHKALSATVAVAGLLLVASSVWYVLDLKEKERRARFRQYTASIAAVEAALRARDPQRAYALIEEAPRDFRNWEWRHLRSRLESSLRKFESRPVWIRSVAYHPDGSWFAAAVGAEVWVYADATGDVVRKLEPASMPRCIRWSPGGHRIAVGTDEALEIWSWPQGVRTYKSADEGEFRRVDFADGGARIVAGVVQGLLLTFDADGSGERSRVPMPTRILAMACDPNPASRRVVLGSADGRVAVLDRESGTRWWTRTVSRRGVHSVSYLDGERVACAADGLVRILRAEDGSEVRVIAVGDHSGPLVPDPTGRRLLAVGPGALHVFDAQDGSRLQRLSGGTLPSQASVHPRGRRVVVASSTGKIREWYLGVGDGPTLLSGHMDDVLTLAVASAGRFAASGGFGGTVRVWDLDADELARAFFGHGGGVTSVRFSPDGRRLASSDSEGEIFLRDFQSGRVERRWKGHEAPIHMLSYLPDGRLVSFGRDGRLRVWNAEQGSLTLEVAAAAALEATANERRPLAVSPDGRWIATGDVDGRVRIWDAEGLAPLSELQGHVKGVTGLAFHPFGALLASVSNDQTLRVWNPTTGKMLLSTGRNPELSSDAGLNCVAFSPDGSRIVTGSYGGSVGLWDTSSGSLLATLELGEWVTELQFTADGTRLVTAHTDGSLRVRDSVPLRERVSAFERAARLRARAVAVVESLGPQGAEADRLLAALEDSTEADDGVSEAARRVIHQRRVTHEAYVARMWRDLTPSRGDPERQGVARALAQGLWRATRHREEPDARCDTLLGLAYYRCGQPERTLRVFALAGALNEQRAPELFAVDLAFAAMACAALARPGEARAHLRQLEELLSARPALATERARGFLAEARAVVR